MITINNVSINNSGNIDVDITAQNGYEIESAKLWLRNDFKDYSLAKDFSFKLTQVSENESFTLEPDEIDLLNFNGLFFIEFQEGLVGHSTEVISTIVAVSNFTKYNLCLSELILNSSVCVENLFSREVCDDNSVNKAISVSLLLDAVEKCLLLGQFVEANLLLDKIDRLCKKCNTCNNEVRNTCHSCNTYTY